MSLPKFVLSTAVAVSLSTVAAKAEDISITLSGDQLASISSAVTSAGNPEDAARLFAKLASQAVGQAVADSLAGALQSVAGQSANENIAGWEQYIGGLSMNLVWPSPGLSASSNLPTYSIQNSSSEATTQDVSVGITITGTF